jgi:hypothetical protein
VFERIRGCVYEYHQPTSHHTSFSSVHSRTKSTPRDHCGFLNYLNSVVRLYPSLGLYTDTEQLRRPDTPPDYRSFMVCTNWEAISRSWACDRQSNSNTLAFHLVHCRDLVRCSKVRSLGCRLLFPSATRRMETLVTF